MSRRAIACLAGLAVGVLLLMLGVVAYAHDGCENGCAGRWELLAFFALPGALLVVGCGALLLRGRGRR